MNWKQIKLVTTREYLTQVKNKTFLVLTLAMPLVFVGIGVLVGFLSNINQEQKTVAVVDQSKLFQINQESDQEIVFELYQNQDIQNIKDSLSKSKTLNALLVIPPSSNLAEIENNTELYTKGSAGIKFKNKVENVLERKMKEQKMLKEGISKERLDKLNSNFNIKIYNVNKQTDDGKNQKDGKDSDFVKLIIAGSLTYIIFMFIMIYGVRVMRNVSEEKSSRVVEIIISSIKPFNLMLGKIFGVTLVALTQFIIWIVLIGVFGAIATSVLGLNIQSNITPEQMAQAQAMSNSSEFNQNASEILSNILSLNLPLILICFMLYFILGYLFYSSIFAAIGAAVDNDSDTQQFTFLPVFPMIIAIYGSFFAVIFNPEGPVAFWLSMIPLTSPISMITRLPYDVPWWQILLSLSLLLGATILMIRFAAKIYRIGILMYGKKPSFKEIYKWLKYNN